jgi:hypothetical protein
MSKKLEIRQAKIPLDQIQDLHLDDCRVVYLGRDAWHNHWVTLYPTDPAQLQYVSEQFRQNANAHLEKTFLDPLRTHMTSDGGITMRLGRSPNFQIVQNRRDDDDNRLLYHRHEETNLANVEKEDVIRTHLEGVQCDCDVVFAGVYESCEGPGMSIVCRKMFTYEYAEAASDASKQFVLCGSHGEEGLTDL